MNKDYGISGQADDTPKLEGEGEKWCLGDAKAIGYWLSAVGYRLSVIGCRLSVITSTPTSQSKCCQDK